MFPTLSQRLSGATRSGIGFAVEFATLGEYAPFSRPAELEPVRVDDDTAWRWDWPARESPRGADGHLGQACSSRRSLGRPVAQAHAEPRQRRRARAGVAEPVGGGQPCLASL